jgi:serine protease AprX
VSQVLAAIQWVVSFQDTYGIKVLNLSLGTDSAQSYRTDPLDYAVERAWAAGITVAVSASNRGPGPGTISKPGDDPFVITVAALDDRNTAGVSDDRLPDFSSRGGPFAFRLLTASGAWLHVEAIGNNLLGAQAYVLEGIARAAGDGQLLEVARLADIAIELSQA